MARTRRMKRKPLFSQAEIKRQRFVGAAVPADDPQPTEPQRHLIAPAQAAAAAPAPSVARRASLELELEPLKIVAQNELASRRDEFEHEVARRRAEFDTEQAALDARIAPLQSELDRVDGYLRLVHALPSPMNFSTVWKSAPRIHPGRIPATLLRAAQQRLAIAGLATARLGSASALSSDIAGMVAFYIRGFDHDTEQQKIDDYGHGAHRARRQFCPALLPGAGQMPEATGFLLQGHPSRKCNGVYRLHGEREGWPVLKNTHDNYCYHTERPHGIEYWALSDSLPKKGDDLHFYYLSTFYQIEFSDAGELPVGPNLWQLHPDGDDYDDEYPEEQMLTVTVLRAEAAVTAAETQLKELLQAEQAPKAALAVKQLQHVAGLLVEGNLERGFDGVYLYNSTCEGWPVMKKAKGGFYFYRDCISDNWALSEFFPSDSEADIHIHALEGAIPVGAHTWRVFNEDEEGIEWEDHTLTVTLLPTSAEVTAAEQRSNAAFQAVQAPMIAAVCAQLENVHGVIVEGHPSNVRINGIYTQHSKCDGWPVLKSEEGMYCCRYPWDSSWCIAHDRDSYYTGETIIASIRDKQVGHAIESTGRLPTGSYSWTCLRTIWDKGEIDDEYKDEGGECVRVVHTLKMTLMLSVEPMAAEARRIQVQREKTIAGQLKNTRTRLGKVYTHLACHSSCS